MNTRDSKPVAILGKILIIICNEYVPVLHFGCQAMNEYDGLDSKINFQHANE